MREKVSLWNSVYYERRGMGKETVSITHVNVMYYRVVNPILDKTTADRLIVKFKEKSIRQTTDERSKYSF